MDWFARERSRRLRASVQRLDFRCLVHGGRLEAEIRAHTLARRPEVSDTRLMPALAAMRHDGRPGGIGRRRSPMLLVSGRDRLLTSTKDKVIYIYFRFDSEGRICLTFGLVPGRTSSCAPDPFAHSTHCRRRCLHACAVGRLLAFKDN